MTPWDVIVEQVLLPIVAVALTAVAGWAVGVIQRHTNASLTEKQQATLHSALSTGIQAALAASLHRGRLTPDLMDHAVREAVKHATGRGAAQAVEAFKLSPADLERMAKAKFHELTAGEKSDKD